MASLFFSFWDWQSMLYMPQHTSLEIFQNGTREALALYGLIDHFEPEYEARVSIWYGAI